MALVTVYEPNAVKGFDARMVADFQGHHGAWVTKFGTSKLAIEMAGSESATAGALAYTATGFTTVTGVMVMANETDVNLWFDNISGGNVVNLVAEDLAAAPLTATVTFSLLVFGT